MLVAIDAERVDEVREAVVAIGRRLGQMAMYFEVRQGVEFLDVPED